MKNFFLLNLQQQIFFNKYKLNHYFFYNINSTIFNYLNSPQNQLFKDNIVIREFNYLVNNSFIFFFIKNKILIPSFLTLHKSYYRKVFFIKIEKLLNILMLDGKKEFVRNNIINNLISFFFFLNKKNFFSKQINLNYWDLIFFFTYTYFNNLWYKLNSNLELAFDFNINLFSNNLYFNNNSRLINLFFFFLKKINILFIFNFHKIDKRIRKYSRKRSGKYKLVFQYIPEYKRLFLLIRWLKKDIKFLKYNKLGDKFFFSLKKLVFSKNKHFLWKAKFFSNRYIFKNFNKKILKSVKF